MDSALEMDFVIRPAEARDAESVEQLAKEFIDYLQSLGGEAEQNSMQRFSYAMVLARIRLFPVLCLNAMKKLPVICFIISDTMLITPRALCTS